MSRLKVCNIFISVYCMDRRKAVSLLQQHSYVHIKLKGSITLLKKFWQNTIFYHVQEQPLSVLRLLHPRG